MEVKKETFIPCVDALKILKDREKQGELNYEQKNAFDYLNKFCKLDDKQTNALTEELRTVGKLLDRHIVAIADMQPKSEEELRMLFSNERTVLADDEKAKILEAVKKHTK